MRRSWPSPLPLVLAVWLVLAGCGSTRTSDTTDALASRAPASTSLSPAGAGSLTDFPLALGYPRKNGDDKSRVRVSARPATTTFRLCGRTAWDPAHATRAVRGVRYRGESEDLRGRTLVLYPTAAAAARVVRRARAAVVGCADEPRGKSEGRTHTLVEVALGDQSVVWTDTFYNVYRGEQQHDTGLVVNELVRVGRAVLLTYEYGEGNGTPASRRRSIADSLRHQQPVIDRLRDLSPRS